MSVASKGLFRATEVGEFRGIDSSEPNVNL